MKIALVGWGVETKSAYEYFGNEHEYIIYSEEPRNDFPQRDGVSIRTLRESRKPGLTGTVEDLSYLESLEINDKIIYTPTARKNLEKLYDADDNIWQKCVSTLNIFFENCPTKNIIGVTGTKGKGTTTSLIAELIKSDGRQVHVGGNIGVPVLSLLKDISEDDWVVLELSSFQLYKFPYSPHIAVHLMMLPEHIEEWHKTMDDYVTAKRNIFAHQTKNDIAVYNPDDSYSRTNVEASAGTHIPYGREPGAYVKDGKIIISRTEIVAVDSVGLRGKHNLDNICAALTAVWPIHQNVQAMSTAIQQFTGLEHRLQLIRELEGISFYDDSFGTTPDTTIVAADAFAENKVMIIGGHDKGNDFTKLLDRLKQDDIRGLVCIGTTGDFVSRKLFDANVSYPIVHKVDVNDWTMPEIIDEARKIARAGDVVLLSTGSASFGIFKDYKERGKLFIDSVLAL
jgi:UDP-N-acetylmuramoylalanine--D-glutamate ligase